MRKPETDRIFIEEYARNADFSKAVKEDFYGVQAAWFSYIDGLCREGEITQQQYSAWTFPGKKYRKMEGA